MTSPSSAIGSFVIGESPIGGATSAPPSFPPEFPGITGIIPSYLYQQYNDDDDLQAFVDAYNSIAQEYLDWFNQVGLPIYTGTPISGDLLDWVANGLYGISRPNITSGITLHEGVLNTFTMNSIPFNQNVTISPPTSQPATDDVFKRVITWHFYKGDGKYFGVRWMKRRIARFLNGYNGTDVGTDQTYRISISFGLDNQVNITILSGVRTIMSSSILNGGAFNTTPLNGITTSFVAYPPLPMAATFKEAVDAGILELPFQFTYVITV